MFGPRAKPDPINVRSLLVVLPTWVGDFVMGTPFLRTIREHFSEAKITFLARSGLKELIRGNPWMDQCVHWPPTKRSNPWHREYREMCRTLRAGRFDVCVILPNAFRAALIAWQSGARRRIGYDRDGRSWLLTDRLPVKNRVNGTYQPMPLVEYYADMAEAIGCPRPNDHLELFTTPDCDAKIDQLLRDRGVEHCRPRVLICPGAKFGMSKCWLPERFAEVADRLVDRMGAAIMISPGPGEEPLAEAIVSAMNQPAVNLANPVLHLGELKSLVKRSHLLLGNDTGPRHFARAFKIPVVTVFGPTFAEWTATSYPAERIVRIPVDCGPCHKKICPLGHLKCMTGVTVDAVYEACRQIMGSHI